MHRLGVGLVAKVTIGVRVVEVADVLHALPQGRQGHRVDLEGRRQDGVLGRPVVPVALAGDAAKVPGTCEPGPARKLIPVESGVGRVELPDGESRTGGGPPQHQLLRPLGPEPAWAAGRHPEVSRRKCKIIFQESL